MKSQGHFRGSHGWFKEVLRCFRWIPEAFHGILRRVPVTFDRVSGAFQRVSGAFQGIQVGFRRAYLEVSESFHGVSGDIRMSQGHSMGS